MPCSNENFLANAVLDCVARCCAVVKRVYKIRKAFNVPVVRVVGGADSVVNDVGPLVVAETYIYNSTLPCNTVACLPKTRSRSVPYKRRSIHVPSYHVSHY